MAQFNIKEVDRMRYRPTKSAEEFLADLRSVLGLSDKATAARLAIARSLCEPVVSLDDAIEKMSASDKGMPIEGVHLLGEHSDMWATVIASTVDVALKDQSQLRTLVEYHWQRGADLLQDDYNEANKSTVDFIVQLASRLPQSSGAQKVVINELLTSISASVVLPVGPIGEDAKTGDEVTFTLNAPGGSPHMAIMGGTNSGKTYTAVTMLKRVRQFGNLPILAFDFKGDLSEKLGPDIGAEILSPPRFAVPLNVLAVQDVDDVGLREAAGRIRDSIGRVKTAKLSGIQSDILREAVYQTLRGRKGGGSPTMADVGKALEAEYQSRSRKPDELISTLNELNQFVLFEPKMSPAEFFSRSWIIRLPQDGTQEVRRLIIKLTLDALDRWLNSLPDSEVVEGRRALRHICMLDEAHVILSTKLPALSNLIRMSRSKGGAIMLVSQSPDDFESDDEGFLDNMGMTVAFNTQAKAGPTKTVFGGNYALGDLPVGEAYCRIRTEAKTRRIVAWRP